MLDNVWSENKYVNLCINILMFLMGINFLHYGQVILPMICLILFIDNNFRFYVNNPKVFVILCLFAVSFYAFSVKNFYCVMGFICPMAYYIGCNMYKPNKDKIKNVIYLLAISMGMHVILNSIFEIIVHGRHGFFMSTTHYDFWTREKISNTSTAINADLIIGCLYYLLFHENNSRIKALDLTVFVLSMFYLSVIGRRTPVMLMCAVMGFSFLYEIFVARSGSEKLRKGFFKIAICFVVFVLIIVLIYVLNIFNAREYMMAFQVFRKFSLGFINDQRFELYFGSFPLMPKYPWGGQYISAILGQQVHDFWIDIYDYAGVVTWFIMIVYSLMYLKVTIQILKDKTIDGEFRILIVGILTSVILQMFLEPVMTGASLFLGIAIIIHGMIERIVIDEQ